MSVYVAIKPPDGPYNDFDWTGLDQHVLNFGPTLPWTHIRVSMSSKESMRIELIPFIIRHMPATHAAGKLVFEAQGCYAEFWEEWPDGVASKKEFAVLDVDSAGKLQGFEKRIDRLGLEYTSPCILA